MRLINATTLKLHFFLEAPDYAILSHTWGSEEATFEQLGSTPPADLDRMAGFRKIRLAAQQAVRDGLEYVWVDTCCIDKTSSAELSESINSMFTWYKNAAICYAYLEDVSVVHNAPEPYIDRLGLPREYIEEEELATARWFTRGWTLQELIAPDEMRFYVKDWKYIGDKQYLEPKLSRITGIHIEALDSGNKLGDFTVATRMSWASSRITTRAEDMAYCLLGLFDVNMPLLYGEGGGKAFTRLQQHVLEDSSDCSIFAWASLESSSAPQPRENRSDMFYPDQSGVSVLASSPRQFHASGNIHSTHMGEIVLTSIGVKLQLPIFRLPKHLTHPAHLDRDLFIILIRWPMEEYDGDQGFRWSDTTGLVVRRCYKSRPGTPDMFLRDEGYDVIRADAILVKAEDVRAMYLCKKVPDGNFLKRMRHDTFNQAADEHRVYPGVVHLPTETSES
jgi:hypothetical protein